MKDLALLDYFTLPFMQESSIADIHRQASYLEKTYSHYFDHTITFTDMETVHAQILRVADTVEPLKGLSELRTQYKKPPY